MSNPNYGAEYKILFADANFDPHAKTFTRPASALDFASRIDLAPDAELFKILRREIGSWRPVPVDKVPPAIEEAFGDVTFDYMVSFVDTDGKPHKVNFARWKSASEFAERLGRDGTANALKTLRREVEGWVTITLTDLATLTPVEQVLGDDEP